jgi:uracil-DNA glycosylase
MASRFDRFLDALSRTEVSDRACNQYSRFTGDVPGNAIRRRNLRRYLEDHEAIGPRALLIGEAPSYRGGKLTGIAFVSETVLLRGVEHNHGRILGADRGFSKATDLPKPSTEASATMVWGTIRHLDPLPMLWNAFPFHPFHAGKPHSNRVPTAAELATGAQFIEMLLRLFDMDEVIAIGNQAAASLTAIGVPHHKVRHPSMGGKNEFVAGVARLLQQETRR